MAHKLALTLAALALSFVAINAAVTTASPSSAYNVTPVTVVDNTTDTSFVNYTKVQFVPGFDNTTIFVYGLNQSTENVALSLVRRSINASTLAMINGSDSTISTTITNNGSYTAIPGQGYLGIAYVYNSTAAVLPDVQLAYTAVNGSLSTVKVSANTNENLTYTITKGWYESGYFYIVYVETNTTAESTYDAQAAYIQAIKAADGSKLWTAPVKVATLNATTAAGSYVIAGPTNSTNSSTINILYKTATANAVYLVVLTINGSSVSSPVALATDVTNVTYTPTGTLGSTAVSAVFIQKTDITASPATNSTWGYYNGNTTGAMVAGSSASGYAAPIVGGQKFTDGYVLVEVFAPATTGDATWYLDYYFANQTRNGSAPISLGTYGNALQMFVDANGAVWGGYYTSDTYLVKAYLGKVIAQTNSIGASILASFTAFIALMIAALFAF